MKLFLYVLLLSCTTIPLVAQTDASVSPKLLGKTLTLPQEKVYLSFDKPFYAVGETMYFKAFIADATTHATDTISGLLYVDFIEEGSNRLIMQQKLKISESTSFGAFYTEGVKSGRLLVRAYTNWMRNVPVDFFFNTVITLSNVNQSAVSDAPKPVINTLQFFPEGGNLVQGLPCNVAFKATDDSGRGIAVKGTIVDEKGEIIAAFNDDFNGMGRFTFKPEAGKKYVAKVEISSKSFDLPEILASGLTMTVDNSKLDMPIRLFAYVNYSADKMPSSFTVLAHQRGKVGFMNQVSVKDKANFKTFRGVIPRTSFDEEGIVTITIFDDVGMPVAERLVFIDNKKRHLTINLKTNKKTYNKREQVTVDVETTDADGKPIAANLSLGVLNTDKITPPQYLEDLQAYLLLSSDLKGMVEKPAFYFEDTTATTRRALDDLLMTQGWRRFTWQKILSGKTDTVKYLQEFGMSINGVAYKKKQALSNETLLISVTTREEGSRLYYLKTDKEGHFTLDNLNFTDTADIRVKIADYDKSYNVNFLPPPPPPSVFDAKTRLSVVPINNSRYLNATRMVLEGEKMRVEKEIQLQEIEVRAKKRAAQTDLREATYTAARTMVVTDRDLGTAYDFLRGQGIDLSRGDDDTILWKDRGELSPVNLIIDDFPSTSSMLQTLSTDEIEKVNIVRNGIMPSLPNVQTFIHIFTKSGNPNYYKQRRYDEKDMTPTTVLYGYNLIKQFYVPNYKEQKPEYQLPDHRTTIYWSPMLKTDKSGKTTVSFFTTDDAANGCILVEGLDKTGRVGVRKSNFKTN